MPIRKWTNLGDPNDPNGFLALAERFYQGLRALHFSERTVASLTLRLRPFFAFCVERAAMRPSEVTRQLIERFQQWQLHYRKDSGAPLEFSTQNTQIAAVKHYFKWLARHDQLLFNPASEIEYPRVGFRLPKVVLTHAEVEQVLALPDTNSDIGLRDRAILETFYSSGVRRQELISLKLPDLDFERGVLFVRRGKGDKDRVVPIGERAIAWVTKYLHEARTRKARDALEQHVFLTIRARGFALETISQLVTRYVRRAKLGKTGSCHLFRHAMATEMLEGGADVRFIQEILGHADLSTTAIYTQVSIRKLKDVHTATHPAATLEPRLRQEPAAVDQAAQQQLEQLIEQDHADEPEGA